MATTTSKPDLESVTSLTGVRVSGWQAGQNTARVSTNHGLAGSSGPDFSGLRPRATQHDALQALLAFSALHEQLRRRKALAARHNGFEKAFPAAEFEPQEHFILDEVLQLVAERAVAITGADGLAIALAENDEIVLRAAAGTVRPDVGARIDRNSAFSGACFRQAQVVSCDDTETDPRVHAEACRKLGARSMIAVPLCGRRRVIGVLEAFFAWPFGFNDSDIRNLTLLAELVLGALKPEDEDRYADSAQAAQKKLETATPASAPAATAAIPSVARTPASPQVAPPNPSLKAESLPAEPEIAPSKTEVASPKPATATAKPTSTAPVASSAGIAAPISETTNARSAPKPDSTESKVAPAPAAAVAWPKPVEPSAIGTAAPAPATAEPENNDPLAGLADIPGFGQLEPERKTLRPTMLYLLIFIVIVAAFAGGVWWKMRTAQLGAERVQSASQSSEESSNASSAASLNKLAGTTPAAPAPTAPSTASPIVPDDAEPSDEPATQQDLGKIPRVTGIRHWSSADSSTIVLDLEDQVQYEPHRLPNPDRIYFDLHNTQLAADLMGKSIEVGDTFLNRIRVAQPVTGMTRIVLETRGNPDFSVSLESNPYRLVVEVHKKGITPKGAVNLFPNAEAEKNKRAIVVPPPTKEDLQLRARVPKLRIVVDAGHGGWDLGTVGRRGLLEKDLALEIAQRLGKLLESRLGSEVIYTRQDDNYIPLDDRAALANQSQADLFVSVHANYSDLPSARGVETYYTNFFAPPGSKEAGLKTTPTAASAATPTLTAADLHERVEQSRHLAASVQRSLYGTLSASNPGLRDRGVREAAFVVLTESAMPGILAEVSFVSSPTDEQKLRSDGYREQIAEALYRGIAHYAASSKSVRLAKQIPVASTR
jgi:N-acetylmuramoyl-L-alanine amidase